MRFCMLPPSYHPDTDWEISTPVPDAATRNPLPRWRGFNLPDLYGAGSFTPFLEDDFRWIVGWGFDFVRLPLSYTLWVRDGEPGSIDESSPALAELDRAVELAGRYGLHVCLNLHRAPGYSVSPERREPFNLWHDEVALDLLGLHWCALARRYAGIAPERLSFDLLNEPPPPRPEFLARLTGGITRARHETVMRSVVRRIRQVDVTRLIILDGLDYGRRPCPELADLPNVAQSCRAYEPFELSHYRAPWMPFGGRWHRPAWPLRFDLRGRRWDRDRLEAVYAPWAALIARGVGVHCGEMGCYRHTPHAVFLAWAREILAVLRGHGIGWALWNFRGPFGVLDTDRTDVAYADWHGHRLDAALLALLQAS